MTVSVRFLTCMLPIGWARTQSFDLFVGGTADEYLVVVAEALQARCQIDRVADSGEIHDAVRADIADHRLAGVDTKVDPHTMFWLATLYENLPAHPES